MSREEPKANAYWLSVVAHGMGRHAKLVSQDDMEEVLKHLLAFECLYVTAVAAIKLSILAMYLRIFPSRGFKIGAWTIGGATIAWCIAIALVCIFQCNPVSTAWRPWDAGVCIDLRASFIGNAVPNIVGDIAILIMYVFTHMSRDPSPRAFAAKEITNPKCVIGQ